MMLAILVLVTVLAIWGTLKNKRANNKFGMLVGGAFSAALAGVTVLALLFNLGVFNA